VAAVVVLLVFMAACNDSGGADDATTTDPETTDEPDTTDDDPGDAEAAAYCDLVAQIDPSALTGLDAESSPNQVKQATTTFLDDNAALLDQIVGAAPDEIADAYTTTLDTFEELARTGDVSLLSDPQAVAADQSVQQYQLANC
jgi:hypothetical protein